MRGIVVGSVFTLSLWVFLGWCGVCAWSWIGSAGVSATALTLASSLACIVIAGIAGVVCVASIGEDEATTAMEVSLATSD